MSGEKKTWKLPIPFRRFSGKPDPSPKTKVGHSRHRVSSVYLSDDSSTNGFVIVPEFDDPARTQTNRDEFYHTSRSSTLPTATSPNFIPPKGGNNSFSDYESIGSLRCAYPGRGSYDTPVADASQDDDLVQRLGSAYEHIRSMPSATPEVVLSSDPQMRRKQLGVPQHSVFNYPIHSSPDLPNPHTSSSDPPSPSLPPAISQDSSQARRLRKRKHPNSASTAPIETEGSIRASQCSSFGAQWNSHIPRLSKPQPFTSNSYDVEKVAPTFRPSSESSRPVVKGVLRKPASGAVPPAPAGWETSLPQIRSPSPFRVDIPLHHTWHDRRFDFSCPPGLISKAQLYETKPRRTSGSTEMLASLAWIGTPRSNPYPANRSHQSASTACLSDRFDIATAVEDDSISDDVLVDRLEKVRRINGSFQPDGNASPSVCSGNSYFLSSREKSTGAVYRSPPLSLSSVLDSTAGPGDDPPSPLVWNHGISESEDAAVWKAARKAVLCIREIIRTEKKYQEALKMLLNAQTATPPPPSMIPRVSALVRASEVLLKSFLEDPSAWGVSTAFVASEDDLEATMVSWCTVVGTFFTDGDSPRSGGLAGKWRLRKSGLMSSSSPVPRPMSTFPNPQLPAVFPVVNTTHKNKERVSGEYHAPQHWRPEPMRQQSDVSMQKSEKANSQVPSRKLSVRDLAIQPIQRVMRYVLLYRDLLDCTPPVSPSRLLVERALEAATRIAGHCDKAQRNPAFYRVS